MVRPALRSRSQARIKRKLPGNNTTVHYKRRRPAPARCPVTGLVLAGVPRMRPAKISRLTKTQKRPSRPYGGKVSHIAVANAIQQKVLEGW